MLETSIAGSLPRPDWLAEPETLKGAWKLSGQALEDGKRRAAADWLRHQEDAGIHIVTNGEVFRTHFVHGFLEGLTGIDWQKMTRMGIRNNRYELDVPTVTGPLSRPVPVHLDEVRFSRAQTQAKFKFTLPGPMTICDTIADGYYGSRPEMALAFADILNAEAKELEAAGVDVIQFDEPAFNVFMSEVKDWGIEALHRAIDGLKCTTAVHICYGYGIQANLDWKKSLGSEWRQYEEIFPALNASRIDQISLECAGLQRAAVPAPAAAGQAADGRRDPGDRRPGGIAGRGRGHAARGLRARGTRADPALHELRHGADRLRRRARQAQGAGRRRRAAAPGTQGAEPDEAHRPRRLLALASLHRVLHAPPAGAAGRRRSPLLVPRPALGERPRAGRLGTPAPEHPAGALRTGRRRVRGLDGTGVGALGQRPRDQHRDGGRRHLPASSGSAWTWMRAATTASSSCAARAAPGSGGSPPAPSRCITTSAESPRGNPPPDYLPTSRSSTSKSRAEPGGMVFVPPSP